MYNVYVNILIGVIQYMNKIQLLKEYTYISICNFDFKILIHFDYDNEVLLYSLKYEDNEYYDNVDYLIEYASSFDEETIDKAIKKFMLVHVWSELDKWIVLNDYNEWKIEVINDGLKLINKTTKQWATWNIYDYDEDYEVVQNKIIKFLKLQTITK